MMRQWTWGRLLALCGKINLLKYSKNILKHDSKLLKKTQHCSHNLSHWNVRGHIA